MAKAELCPVCKGSGRVGKFTKFTCNGKGWVKVGKELIPINNPDYDLEDDTAKLKRHRKERRND